MSVCVRPQAIKNCSCNQTSPTDFKILYMTLAIDITDGCNFSNKTLIKCVISYLLPRKSKVMLLAIHFTIKGI